MANCMYIANTGANTIADLIANHEAITTSSVNQATESFKVAHRPINPMTEGTNGGKNVYTRFMPYKPLPQLTGITNPKDLFMLGQFVEIQPTCLNHNYILDDLECNFNILVPRKAK